MFVTERSSSIELSTVYRTLELLSSMNLVAMIDTGEKQRLYELVGTHDPHIHLVCQECRKITGVDVNLFQTLLNQLEDQAHFHVDLSNLTVPGLCAECKQAKLIKVLPA
jgi:Fur family ferric uptake transcriptional regulator